MACPDIASTLQCCAQQSAFLLRVSPKNMINQQYTKIKSNNLHGMTFSYRKIVRKQCIKCRVNFSELSKYKNVNRILPEDKWGHLSGSLGDFSIKFERSCRNIVTDFGNDTAAQQPITRLHNLSYHRRECEMLEIAQEGERQLPGQQGHIRFCNTRCNL